jgi:hypothetical protein
MYFYSHMTKSAWLLTRITLVITYLVNATPLADTLQQAYIILDERFCDHPVTQVAYNAQRMLNKTRDRQSQFFDEAVTEYRRRYQMPPPPYFDKWGSFQHKAYKHLGCQHLHIQRRLMFFGRLSCHL